MSRSSRPGLALVLVLGAVLLMDLLVLSMLALATQDRKIADGLTRAAVAAQIADAELLQQRSNWPSLRHGNTPGLVDTLDDGLFLLRSTRVQSHSALLLRTLPIHALATWFPSAIETDGPRFGGFVESSPFIAPCARLCDGAHGNAPLATGESLPSVPLELLDSLDALADYALHGTIEIAPIESAGKCDYRSETNWGAPRDGFSACHDYFPLIIVNDHLTISGEGQGILLVRGTLRLEPNTYFRGVIIVFGGRLITLPETHIEGAIRGVGAGPMLLMQSTIHYDSCTIWGVLNESDALNRLLPMRRQWVPVF